MAARTCILVPSKRVVAASATAPKKPSLTKGMTRGTRCAVMASQPWDHVLPQHIATFGPDLLDHEKRARWCSSFFLGGSFVHAWSRASQLKLVLLSACSPCRAQRMMLLGKHLAESGILNALSSAVGSEGRLTSVDIASRALEMLTVAHPATGKRMQWDFEYLRSIPGESLERVVLFGASSHIANLEAFVHDVRRVLTPGGRLVVADAPPGGRELFSAAHLDAHLEGFVARLLSGMVVGEQDLPDIGPRELVERSGQALLWAGAHRWQGAYVIYGNKAAEGEAGLGTIEMTEAEREFLREPSSEGDPWRFLTPVEARILGGDSADTGLQKMWGRALFFAGNLGWMYSNADSLLRLMYHNLSVKRGGRTLVIGEVLESLGFLRELRRKTGRSGEVVSFDIVQRSRDGYQRQWEARPGVVIPEKHQWEYDYADSFPDDYFDLVWLPQGVHHAKDWKTTAPRLLRVLKPGGQVMMIECRTCSPTFYLALENSALLRCIAEKVFWGMDTAFRDMPDYSTRELSEAFGESLVDTFALEWKGWLVFWGTKGSVLAGPKQGRQRPHLGKRVISARRTARPSHGRPP